jgi:hypothetical protein
MAGKRTTDSTFDDLHSIVADALIEQIRAWKESRLVEYSRVVDADTDGEKQYVKVFPPALLAQAIKFLKDNGIDQPAREGNRVDTLKDEMPDFGDADNVVPMRR